MWISHELAEHTFQRHQFLVGLAVDAESLVIVEHEHGEDGHCREGYSNEHDLLDDRYPPDIARPPKQQCCSKGTKTDGAPLQSCEG